MPSMLVEQGDGHVTRITLDRPDRLNAIDVELTAVDDLRGLVAFTP